MKRELTSEEKEICKEQLERLKEEFEYQKYLIEYTNLILNKGLRLNYERELKLKQQELKRCSSQIEEIEFTITAVKDQMKNGVELKENMESEN
ncbi:MAG: hypothetical protein AABY22_18285 [Nanoarchaeota archaeon]